MYIQLYVLRAYLPALGPLGAVGEVGSLLIRTVCWRCGEVEEEADVGQPVRRLHGRVNAVCCSGGSGGAAADGGAHSGAPIVCVQLAHSECATASPALSRGNSAGNGPC